ncbi:DUF6602 domain-containing protein [Larkinella sp. GY13]|uniref:DUF6602 domain-containing protein n=1 Tax=Larkinella sp. GY13 TaxID=3453720 RepID=UPI003EECCC71
MSDQNSNQNSFSEQRYFTGKAIPPGASNDLIEFMQAATRDIQFEYQRIKKRAKEDPGTAGDQGEENWATLLRDWLPPTFQIVTKGRILGAFGATSPQVDVIVLQPEYPKSLLDKKLYLAGGILAVFECKTTLKAEHIKSFFETSRIIKNLPPRRTGNPFKELQCPILYGLLAHNHSWVSVKNDPIDTIDNILWDAFNTLNHPIEMPEFVCVANIASWESRKSTFMHPHFFNFPDAHPDHLKDLVQWFGPNGSASAGYTCYKTNQVDTNDRSTPIGSFFTSLLYKLSLIHPSLDPLAEYFAMTQIQGAGSGRERRFDASSIYSSEVFQKLLNGHNRMKPSNDWPFAF